MIVYTAISGGYDILKPLPSGVTGVCFADVAESRKEVGWTVEPLTWKGTSNRITYQYYKYNPHILFPGQTTLWIDGSYALQKLPPEAELGAFKHPEFNTLSAELERCAKIGKLDSVYLDIAERAVERYKADGFVENGIHVETGLMVRQDTPRTKAFNEIMWAEVQKGVLRDQISCDYATWKAALPVTLLKGLSTDNEYALLHWHAVVESRPEIYYFTPFDQAGLGVAYNKCCSLVPDNAWICLLDSDIMLLPSDFGKQIEEVLVKHPEFDVYTCLATRCFTDNTLLSEAASNERDLIKLRAHVLERKRTHYGQVKEIPCDITGYFMLFRKSLWKEVPFREVGAMCRAGGEKHGGRVLGIDTQWSQELKAAGKRACVMEGVVAIHYYRLGVDEEAHKAALEQVARVPNTSRVARLAKFGRVAVPAHHLPKKPMMHRALPTSLLKR